MASRIWHRLAIAVAAIASVATSQLPATWNASGGAMLQGVVFDSQRTQVRYAIHAEVMGEGPYTDLAGVITAHVKAQQLGMFDSPIALRLTLRSTTNALETVEELTLPNITPEIWGDLTAFTHCTTPPCAEDFELVVETIGTGAPALDVTGDVGVTASGDNNELERTTMVTVVASPLP